MVDQNNIEQCCAAQNVQSCQQYFVPQKRLPPPPPPLQIFYTLWKSITLFIVICH